MSNFWFGTADIIFFWVIGANGNGEGFRLGMEMGHWTDGQEGICCLGCKWTGRKRGNWLYLFVMESSALTEWEVGDWGGTPWPKRKLGVR